MEDKYNARFSSGFLFNILKSTAAALAATFAILVIAALLLCFTDFPEMYTLPSAIAATILGVFAGGNMAARKNPENSLASSLLTALIYSVITYIIGSILDGRITFTWNTVLFGAISLITGAISSILSKRTGRSGTYKKSSGLIDRLNKKSINKGYRFRGGKL